MSVERRVKPSTRAMEAIRKKRKVIAIVLAAVLVIGIGGGIGYTVYKSGQGQRDLVTDAVATRTLLSSRTTYTGQWIEEPEGLFEVYLPGDKLDDAEYASQQVNGVRDVDYDNGLKKAYGVVVGTERFDIGVSDSPSDIVATVAPSIVADIGKACKGRGASGAYDLEIVTLTDGRQAIRIDGDVEMTLLYANPDNQDEPTQEKVTYPVLAYITLEKGYPVAVWGTWDSWDAMVAEEVPTAVEQCANTVWQREYLGDQTEWTPVKSTVGPDGVIIYEETPAVSDEPVGVEGDSELGNEPEEYVGPGTIVPDNSVPDESGNVPE